MFFKKKENIPFDENIIKKNRVPVLPKDREWQAIFGKRQNKAMETLRRELEQLLKEEGELQSKLKAYKLRKKTVMNKIIHFSNIINTQEEQTALVELEKSREEMAQLNGQIEEILTLLEGYPERIERLNLALLKETVKMAYTDLLINNSRREHLQEEIEKLRLRLGNLWDEKEETEKRMQLFYTFLHSIIGHEEMEKLDIRFLQEDGIKK